MQNKPFQIDKNVKRFRLVNATRLSKSLKMALGLKRNREYDIEIFVSEKPGGSDLGVRSKR